MPLIVIIKKNQTINPTLQEGPASMHPIGPGRATSKAGPVVTDLN